MRPPASIATLPDSDGERLGAEAVSGAERPADPAGDHDVASGTAPGDGVSGSPETAFSRFERGLREGRAAQAMLAALAAWTITVAPAAFTRGSPATARVAAILALPCGVGAPLVAVVRRRLARHIGISAFLTLAVLTWLIASPAIHPSRLDPVRAAIGAVAWGVFALSWRDRWPTGRRPDADPDAPILQARTHLPPLAVPLAAAGAVAGLAVLLVAWRVRDPDRALLAQAVAVACSIALTTAAATVAIARGHRPHTATRRLTPHAVRPLLLLVTFAVVGAIVMMLR